MTRPRLSILHNLARSGGTIISRCLGCMNGILLLSEIHPQGSQIVAQGYETKAGLSFSPGVQATLWHDLSLTTISGRSIPAIVSASMDDFLAQLREIRTLAEERQLHLILRDWGHLDYIGVPFRHPDYRDALVQILEPEFDLTHIYLIRHPIDQWRSLSGLSLFHQVTPETFLQGYLHYLRAARAQIGAESKLDPQLCYPNLFKYESFLEDPAEFLQQLTIGLAVPYDPLWTERWQDYHQVTGDESASRSRVEQIRPSHRLPLEPEIRRRFEACPEYHQILKITGYESMGSACSTEVKA